MTANVPNVPSTASSMAELMKGAMANMPDTLDTKKEIEEYFKNVMKNIKVDDTDKPKKGLNRYQQYVKDNSKSVKEQNPDLTGKQVLSLIAKMWKELNGNGDIAKPTEEVSEITEAKEEITEVKEEITEVKPKAKTDSKKKK